MVVTQAQVSMTEGAREAAVHLRVAGSFCLDYLKPLLTFVARRLWPDCTLEFAPYGQVLEQLWVRAGTPDRTARAAPAADVVLVRPEDLLRDGEGRVRVERAALAVARAHVLELARGLQALGAGGGTLVLGLLPAAPHVARLPELAGFDRWTRMLLARAAARQPAGVCCDLERAVALYEVAEVHDPFRDELAHVPFTDEYLAALATLLVRALRACWEPPRKAIVLDCDNTLWGGACGEQPHETLWTGGPYAQLRAFMLAQARAGCLLCLASRNRETDVLAAFARCAAPLTLDRIAAHRISTGRKSEAIRSLAAELELALDAFVVVDDDPVECAELRAELPELAVVELPRRPEAIPAALAHEWVFDRPTPTAADRGRGAAYALEARRRRERECSPSAREFVEGLHVRVEVHALRRGEVARAAQLFARTNQFNLNGARCSAAELLALDACADTEVLTVHVRDRLGDYGMVGVAALRRTPPAADLLVLALSCRVLRRGVEIQLIGELARRAQQAGCTTLRIAFAATERNRPLREFLDRLAAPDPAAATEAAGRRELRLERLRARLARLEPL